MSSSLQARMTLSAISPRLATNIFLIMLPAFPGYHSVNRKIGQAIYDDFRFQPASMTKIRSSSFKGLSLSGSISATLPFVGLLIF